ncbi:hypothetical protein [Hoeflea sp.]|uniref:hypothetical protein n=1 Tax=Hoeflea sp. TaxID=1940281 RepID=UPI0019CA8816|nr:hypothetical protein [Hoeflea sp.]MBC7279958.1 hypothetical protein [Hoeflea sp.]
MAALVQQLPVRKEMSEQKGALDVGVRFNDPGRKMLKLPWDRLKKVSTGRQKEACQWRETHDLA